jgi:argininosuccinate lyase
MKLWKTEQSSDDELVEQFTAGEDVALDRELVPYEIFGSLAHAVMLEQIGVLTAAELARLRTVLVELLDAEIRLTVQDEDVHTKLEALLTEKLGELGQKIHTGRSRNDQVLVDIRLYTKARLSAIALEALDLASSLQKLAQAHEFVPMPGYTHTRRAMLASVGLWAAAFAESLLEDLRLLAAAYELNDQSPLGAAAGYGVPLKLDRELTARLLGFRTVQQNTLAVMNSRGKLEFAVLCALSCVMMTLSRLANDLIWFSGDEFRFFEISQRFCTGSSLMPNKQNPDVLELVRARAARVIGGAGQLAFLTHGLSSGYHRDLQETKGLLMRGLETTYSALRLMTGVVSELRVNRAQLEAACSADLFAVDRVIEQVQKKGIPFRQAYQNVKRDLARVQAGRPEEALKKRAHLGGPGHLRLGELKAEIESRSADWRAEREQFLGDLERLKVGDPPVPSRRAGAGKTFK